MRAARRLAGVFIYSMLILTHVLPYSGFAASLALTAEERWWPGPATEELSRLKPGRSLEIGDPLFPRIGDRSTLAAWVAEMEQRFGGPS